MAVVTERSIKEEVLAVLEPTLALAKLLKLSSFTNKIIRDEVTNGDVQDLRYHLRMNVLDRIGSFSIRTYGVDDFKVALEVTILL